MEAKIEFIAEGGVTSPQGYHAGATYAGIKKEANNALDLGILFSEAPCKAAALFTSNRTKAAPIVLCQQRLQAGRAVAIVVDSGCANAYNGEQGLRDAAEMLDVAAGNMGLSSEDVLVASTGVIGKPLPMRLIRDSIEQIVLSLGGYELARAMMTTDTILKEAAVAVQVGDNAYAIVG